MIAREAAIERGEDPDKKKEEEEEEEEVRPQFEKPRKKAGVAAIIGAEDGEDDDVAPIGEGTSGGYGAQLTRKQREERDAALAKRRWEEKHARGETDEAKADLKRLQEVKRRREEAAKKKAEEDEARKAAEAAAKSSQRDSALKDCGLEGARLRGSRSKAQKKLKEDKTTTKKEDDFYVAYATTAPAENTGPIENKGNIDTCREIEDDFM